MSQVEMNPFTMTLTKTQDRTARRTAFWRRVRSFYLAAAGVILLGFAIGAAIAGGWTGTAQTLPKALLGAYRRRAHWLLDTCGVLL